MRLISIICIPCAVPRPHGYVGVETRIDRDAHAGRESVCLEFSADTADPAIRIAYLSYPLPQTTTASYAGTGTVFRYRDSSTVFLKNDWNIYHSLCLFYALLRTLNYAYPYTIEFLAVCETI